MLVFLDCPPPESTGLIGSWSCSTWKIHLYMLRALVWIISALIWQYRLNWLALRSWWTPQLKLWELIGEIFIIITRITSLLELTTQILSRQQFQLFGGPICHALIPKEWVGPRVGNVGSWRGASGRMRWSAAQQSSRPFPQTGECAAPSTWRQLMKYLLTQCSQHLWSSYRLKI